MKTDRYPTKRATRGRPSFPCRRRPALRSEEFHASLGANSREVVNPAQIRRARRDRRGRAPSRAAALCLIRPPALIPFAFLPGAAPRAPSPSADGRRETIFRAISGRAAISGGAASAKGDCLSFRHWRSNGSLNVTQTWCDSGADRMRAWAAFFRSPPFRGCLWFLRTSRATGRHSRTGDAVLGLPVKTQHRGGLGLGLRPESVFSTCASTTPRGARRWSCRRWTTSSPGARCSRAICGCTRC